MNRIYRSLPISIVRVVSLNHDSVCPLSVTCNLNTIIDLPGPDLGEAKRGVSEQVRVQGPCKPLFGCRSNAPVVGPGGGGGGGEVLRPCRMLAFGG